MKKIFFGYVIAIAITVLTFLNHSIHNIVFGLGDNITISETDQINRVVGYYGAWSAYSGFTPDKLDPDKLTHINYAFANIGSDLKITLGYPDRDPENFKLLNKLKEENPDLKTLISVGGWTWSGLFSDVAETEQSRAVFADSCVDFIVRYGFDGVDLDWEYPVGGGLDTNINRPEDKQNFTLLLKEIREKLDARGLVDNKHYLLTISGGAGNYYINNTELGRLHEYLDFANIMTYDFHGSWDTYTDYNSPLYYSGESSPQDKWSVDSSVNAWLDAGFPKDKLVVGIPFYGYIYDGVKDINNGLYQKFSEAKSISYNSVSAKYLNALDYSRYYNTQSMVPSLFNGSTYITYEDEQSIGLKAEYIKTEGLGGAMIWELSQDPDMVLLNALAAVLNPSGVKSAENHWSEEAVNYLVSRQVIKNPDTFNPEGFITRGEFAGYITRALGIYRLGPPAVSKFSDVAADSPLAEAIALSVEYGITSGYPDGTFRPEEQITRQEAMVMYGRAMEAAGLPEIYDDRIESYADKDEVEEWAYPYVKKVLSSGIFNGTSSTSISPRNAFKYAEAATAVKNLLLKSGR